MDRLPRVLVRVVTVSGGPKRIISHLFSLSCKKFCAIQHLMSSRQDMRLLSKDLLVVGFQRDIKLCVVSITMKGDVVLLND